MPKIFLGISLAVLCSGFHFVTVAQPAIYDDYVGGGHNLDVIVTASSDYALKDRQRTSGRMNTIDGKGLDGRKHIASRFLFQAGFGGTEAEIENLARDLDLEGWIDNQMGIHETHMLALTRQAYNRGLNMFVTGGGNASDYKRSVNHFEYAWWQAAMTHSDVLRQRVAQAYSEIFVISANSTILGEGDPFASYYDIFLDNAFGNYSDILKAVALHPSMGIFLSHFRNEKTDTLLNIHPDENFAREIMQLFSIGLFKLNQNGTMSKDVYGNSRPTYDLTHVRGLAKVFTGLGAGAVNAEGQAAGRSLAWNIYANYLDYTVPMAMYEEQHEPGPKTIVGDFTIPAGQTGMQDIDMAIDHLSNHANVGPFIALRLIQQLVKSNPSPGYIYDVASVFNDNGEGVRGDMGAVIKEILLNEEARECLWMTDPTSGKLRSPVSRYAHAARVMEKTAPQGLYWTNGYSINENTYHLPMYSPGVFNFYMPDYRPIGPITDQGLVAPEFQIYNSVTSVGYGNEADKWTRRQTIFQTWELDDFVAFNIQAYTEYAKDPDVLINKLDVVFTHGRLSEETRAIIKNALTSTAALPVDALTKSVEMAFYLFLISPDYCILK